MLWCLRNLNRNPNTLPIHHCRILHLTRCSERVVPVAISPRLMMAVEQPATSRATRNCNAKSATLAKQTARDVGLSPPPSKRTRTPRAPSTPAAGPPKRLCATQRGDGVVVQDSGQATADDACAGVANEPPEGPAAAEGPAAPKKTPTRRTKKEYMHLDIQVPTPVQLLAMATTFVPPPRPVPVLGYACLNMTLREKVRPAIYTNRNCTKKTLDAKGLGYISELTLQNAMDLPKIIQWNHEHNIRLFRLSSNIVPWMSAVGDIQRLKDYDAIAYNLKLAGDMARLYDQRLTFHPSHFVKLASLDDEYVQQSMNELEMHSQMFDVMGFTTPSPWNKINIHIGGVYNGKQDTLKRFAANASRLSTACRARLTVENDDTPNAFSLEDLLPMAHETGIPLVFDFHHYKFIDTSLTEEESLLHAMSTWPRGIKPVVHWSESQEGRMPKAHSNYVYGPMNLYGQDANVDVMIEAKCKELALMRFLEQGVHVKQEAHA